MEIALSLKEAIQARHSVRAYTDQPINGDTLTVLQQKIDEVNAVAGLHVQLVLDEPKAFLCAMAKSGKSIDDIWKASGFRSRSSVFRILNKHGIKLNRGKHSGPIKKKSERASVGNGLVNE